MSADVAASMKAVVENFLQAFDGEWTTDKAMADRAPECMHEMLPASLGVPPKNNDAWAARFEHVKHIVNGGKMTLDDYVGAPEERRAVARSTFVGTSTVGAYRNEYIWFFSFTDDGRQITKITEFIDTQAVQELRSRLVQAGLATDQGR